MVPSVLFLVASLAVLVVLFRLFGFGVDSVVEELDDFGVKGERGKELSQELGENFESSLVRVVEINPDFDTVEGLGSFGGREAETIDVFGLVESLAHEVEHQVPVQLVLVINGLIDGEDEPSSGFVLGVLPLGLDALLEKLHRVDSPPTALRHFEAIWVMAYA